MGANAIAGKKPSMLFPFGPEQPCIKQYSAAHRIRKIHRTANTNAMYRRVRILIITTQYRERRPGGSSASNHQSDSPPGNDLANIAGLATNRGAGGGQVADGVTRNIVCLFREPDAGNLPVRFDEREQETGPGQTGLRWRGESHVD